MQKPRFIEEANHSFETTAIKGYLVSGILLTQTKPFTDDRGHAIMALWSAGIEDLLKTTIVAFASFDRDVIEELSKPNWNDSALLWEETQGLIYGNPVSVRPEIQPLVTDLNNDTVLDPLLEALTGHAASRRCSFEGRQQRELPTSTVTDLWARVRFAVDFDPVVLQAQLDAEAAGRDPHTMMEWEKAQSDRLSSTLLRFWSLIAEILQLGALGSTAEQLGHSLRPPRRFARGIDLE